MVNINPTIHWTQWNFHAIFFLKARVERNRQLALARRSSVIPEKNPRRWEWIYIAGWKMDPEWRRISYWKWGYSIAMFTRGYLDVTSVAYKSNGIYNWWDFRFRYVWTNWRPCKDDKYGPKASSNHDFFDVTGLCWMGYKALHGFCFQLSNAKNLVL